MSHNNICRMQCCSRIAQRRRSFITRDGHVDLCDMHFGSCHVCGQSINTRIELFTWCLYERAIAHRRCVLLCRERDYELSLLHRFRAVRECMDAWCWHVSRRTGCIYVSIHDQFLRQWLDNARVWQHTVPVIEMRQASQAAVASMRAYDDDDTDTSDSSFEL